MQKWLDNNDIFMYLTYNGDKSVVAEKFIRTLKGKIYQKKWWFVIFVFIFFIKTI